jgi:cytochrome oxidase Cu insertion factor (SCO1/SenC/PrrC family)
VNASIPHVRSRRARVLAVAATAMLIVGACGGGAPAAGQGGPPVTGVELDRAVPDVALVGEDGQPTSLSALQGRYVVLTPFLTLCHEVCPITTGAFLELQQAIEQAGVANQVTLVEATVDPGRDTPARLRAYAQMTGLRWTLLTGSAAQLAELWKAFGITYSIQPEDSPAPVDWWTHQPETYDVGHNDGLFFLDPQGHERIAIVGIADVGGRLDPTLKSLLNDQGLQNLQDPGAAWTVPQALDDLGHLMGRSIPAAS